MSANVSPECCPCTVNLDGLFSCDRWNESLLKNWFDHAAVMHICETESKRKIHLFSKAFWLLRAQNQSASQFGPPASTNIEYAFPHDACTYSCELIERIKEELSEGCA
tara:strand:- start:1290 stop:1613 length:324 start_codon:yes stop_codon:yes gene_type:complete